MSQQEASAAPAPRRIPVLALVLLVAVVALGIYIGTNVLGVLFAVVSPPLPPLPPGMDAVSHESDSYGVDLWKYTTTGDACEVVQYIQDNGGVCRVAPMQCGEYQEDNSGFTVANSVVARCVGSVEFSIFNMQWWALIMRQPDTRISLELHREVYWIGTGPQ